MRRPTRSQLLGYLTILWAAILAGGCSGRSPAQATAIGDEARASTTGRESAAMATPGDANATERSKDSGTIQLAAVDYDGLMQFISSHKGNPLVLDIWSTSCDPCVRELPNLVRLQDDYREQGVVCVSLNIDYTGAEGTTPDEAQGQAREVLDALGVNVHNLYCTTPDKALYRTDLFQANKVYAIPAILVFDKSGKAFAKFGEASGGDSPYVKVRAAIDELL